MALIPILVLTTSISYAFAAVSLTTNGLTTTVSNEALSVSFKANATVSSVKINGVNIASTNENSFRLDWHADGEAFFTPKTLTVVENSSTLAHFYWSQPGSPGAFHIELHYVMIDGLSGIYSWAKYTNNQNDSVSIGGTRIVYRFDPSVLTQATNGIRTGTLYTYDYLREQTKVQDETWELPNGTYYTKYDYSGYLRETLYQGVFGNGFGAFLISASREYHAGGPLAQDLLVHQDSLILNILVSSHFGVDGLTAPAGWNHIYGPWLIYFNTGSDKNIFSDVESRARIEQNIWPYSFVRDGAYPTIRGSITGIVTGQKNATIVVYDSSEEFSVQSLGYLYTTKTDSKGFYNISKIRPGRYKIVAYPLAGHGSENIAATTITVFAGNTTEVTTLALPEPHNIIWSIGNTNRRSNEYVYSNKERNYAYHTLPPRELNFTIGFSNPENDWYYAQTKVGTWTIKYQDSRDDQERTLRVALAAASLKPRLIVSINGHQIGTISCGNDHSIYRSAMQSGAFYSYVFKVKNNQVGSGINTLALRLSTGQIMYDAISLQRG